MHAYGEPAPSTVGEDAFSAAVAQAVCGGALCVNSEGRGKGARSVLTQLCWQLGTRHALADQIHLCSRSRDSYWTCLGLTLKPECLHHPRPVLRSMCVCWGGPQCWAPSYYHSSHRSHGVFVWESQPCTQVTHLPTQGLFHPLSPAMLPPATF